MPLHDTSMPQARPLRTVDVALSSCSNSLLSSMTKGALMLGEVAERTPTLELTCGMCDRRGRFVMTRLLRDYGLAIPIPELLALLTADCPRRADASLPGTCEAKFPQLPGLFPG